MTDDLVARLRAYDGRIWETTVCYNGLREEAADALEQERGDARTLRGFIATYKMTPSMMASRAETAEARVRELEAVNAALNERAAQYERLYRNAEAEAIERCAQAVHGAVQMIPMGQVDASEFLDVIEDAIAAAIRKLAQEVKS